MRVHSPMTLLPPFGQPLPSDRLVPSTWFRTTSTVYSAHRLRVCCTPKPDGVRCVSGLRHHHSPTEVDDRWETVTLSRNAVHTLRRIPLASSRTASLRPLPSCRSVASRPLRAPKHPTRPFCVPTGRRHMCVSHSRSRSSASATPSFRSPSLAIPAVETAGRARCTVFACSPEGALAGQFNRRRSVNCETRFNRRRSRDVPGFPRTILRVSVKGDCEGVSTR